MFNGRHVRTVSSGLRQPSCKNQNMKNLFCVIVALTSCVNIGVSQVIKDTVYYKTTRLEGKDDDYRMTWVHYHSPQQVIAGFVKKAEDEMWTREKKDQQMPIIRKMCLGGSLDIRISRLSIGWANTENFTVIVQDSLSREVLRKELDSNIPESKNGDLWQNFDVVNISKRVSTPFFVYVIDELGMGVPKYKFKITK